MESEKARIIKEALKIVDELAKTENREFNFEELESLEKLINKAKKITKNPLWKLK